MPLWIVSSAGSGSVDPLEPAALRARASRAGRAVDLDFHDDRRVRHARAVSASTTPTWPKPWSSDCSPVSTRSNCSSRTAAASASATTRGVGRRERVDSTWIARSAPRASASRMHLRGARRTGGAHHDLAAVLLLEPQRLLERVGVRLVELEAGVVVADPGLRLVDAQLPLARHDLLDADGDLHAFRFQSISAFAAPGCQLGAVNAGDAELKLRR